MSPGIYSSPVSCWPELCSCSLPLRSVGWASLPSVGCRKSFCFILLALLLGHAEGVLTPSRAFSSSWELQVNPQGTQGTPQSQDVCLQVIYAAELRVLACNHSFHCTHIKEIAFIIIHSQRLHDKGWAREKNCFRGALKGDGIVWRWGALERPSWKASI